MAHNITFSPDAWADYLYWQSQKNMAEMEELGMQIYDYTSCPNEVDL